MKSTKSIKSILTLFALALVCGTAANAQPQYRKALDFDGDNKADMTVLRNAGVPNMTWYTRQSSNGAMRANQFGIAGLGGGSGNAFDTPQAGDYDGDGKADLTVVRRGQGAHSSWFILRSGSNTMTAERFGTATDSIAAADYDGDGKTDMAVVRGDQSINGYVVYIQQSSNNQMVSRVQYNDPTISGNCSVETGVDIDGDGKQDLAQICFTATNNMVWVVKRASDGVTERHYWGTIDSNNNYDMPVPADYDGDGKTDIAVVRQVQSGNLYHYHWYIRRSSNGTMQTMQFGLYDSSTNLYDTPVPADYDGDGKADIAVFRQQTNSGTPAETYFYVARSGSGNSVQAVQWGTRYDKPLKIEIGNMPSL